MPFYDRPNSQGRQHSSPSPREGFERVGDILTRVWPEITGGLDLSPDGHFLPSSPGGSPSSRVKERTKTGLRRLPRHRRSHPTSFLSPRTPLDSEKA